MTMQANMLGGDYALLLTRAERALLRRRVEPPTVGKTWGGTQTLASTLQERERRGELLVSASELERAFVYAYAYGDGTWQRHYFRPVVEAAKRAGWVPTPALVQSVRQRRRDVKARGEA